MVASTNQRFILEFVTRGIENIDGATSKIEKLNDKVNGLATAILGVGFVSFLAGALEAADRVSDFSDATNISISSLKAFGAALDESGGKAKNTEKIINGFYAAIEQANSGSLKTRDAFAAVGVSLEDLATLSETDLLNKTIAGLKELPAGANRSAIATELLTRAFRGVDPKNFEAALDPAKYLANEEATKRAAAAQQLLEEKYRTLQEGAIAALEPIIKLTGDHKLTTESATKIVTLLGIAFGLAFGANVIASIIKLNTAILGTAAAATLVAKNPWIKAITIAGLAALEGGAAYYAYSKALESVDVAQQKAADSAKDLKGNQPGTPGTPGKLSPADAAGGNANRKQELDANQRAVIDSEKRIEQARAEIKRFGAYSSASEIEKVTLESESNIAKLKAEIYSNTNLNRAQKDKEFTARRTQEETKAASDIAKIRQDQEAQILQQKAGYQQQINAILGIEQTEVQKVTNLIAEQPNKYKEIGAELLKNAAAQDVVLKKTRDLKAELNDKLKIEMSLFDFQLQSSMENQKRADLFNASNETERRQVEAIYALKEKALGLEKSLSTWTEYSAIMNGKSTKSQEEQASILLRHRELANEIYYTYKDMAPAIRANIAEDQAWLEQFSTGWGMAYKKYAEDAGNAAKQAGTYFNTFTKGFEDAWVNAITKGKFAWKDLINTMIAEMARAQARNLFASLFGPVGSNNNLSGPAGAALLGLPGYAAGGMIPANQLSVVGEKGPELFIPKTSGTILPNNMLSAGSPAGIGNTAVTYNINAVDALSFKSMIARDPSFIHAVAMQGAKGTPGRY